MRFLAGADWRRVAPPPKHDLRALVAVANLTSIDRYDAADGSGPLSRIDVDDEIARVMPALRGMEVAILGQEHRTTLPTLEEVLGQWRADILYLVCHGVLGADGDTRLFLENDDGRAAGVPGSDFIRMVDRLPHHPTIVVLCACASAGDRGRTADAGALSAVGPGLARTGVAAVVAMQGNITVETAKRFLPEFFTELARDGVVDRAVAVARSKVTKRPDWWVPVLFTRLKRGRTYYVTGFGAESQEKWRTIRGRNESLGRPPRPNQAGPSDINALSNPRRSCCDDPRV